MLTISELDSALAPAEVLAVLDDEGRQLVGVCRELYTGDWNDMAEDIRRRQAGKPYLFRTAIDPGAALAWVERFRIYEAARGESLAAALPEEN